jgi:hypothetical protein
VPGSEIIASQQALLVFVKVSDLIEKVVSALEAKVAGGEAGINTIFSQLPNFSCRPLLIKPLAQTMSALGSQSVADGIHCDHQDQHCNDHA